MKWISRWWWPPHWSFRKFHQSFIIRPILTEFLANVADMIKKAIAMSKKQIPSELDMTSAAVCHHLEFWRKFALIQLFNQSPQIVVQMFRIQTGTQLSCREWLTEKSEMLGNRKTFATFFHATNSYFVWCGCGHSATICSCRSKNAILARIKIAAATTLTLEKLLLSPQFLPRPHRTRHECRDSNVERICIFESAQC